MGIIEKIDDKLPELSKGHKAVATYIKEHYDQAAYMTAAKLGEVTGVSESTVVRFSMEMGFEGYPHFQRTLKEEMKNKLTSIQRLDYTERFADDRDVIKSIIEGDMENLKETVNSINYDEYEKAASAILDAHKIYLMGLRSSSPLSSFMHFYMTLLFDEVIHIHSNSANEVFEQILPIKEGDVMIGISFPRYSNRTIRSMEYAKKKGATVIVITDKDDTPMTKYADIKLFAKSSMASFVDSLAAPLSVINALLVTLGIHRKEHIRSSFESLEDLWSEYSVYDSGEDRRKIEE